MIASTLDLYYFLLTEKIVDPIKRLLEKKMLLIQFLIGINKKV